MTGTEYARISGSYSTAYIGTYQVISQSTANNTSTIRLRGYFYYGGGSSVTSSYSTFQVNGTNVKTGSYNYSNGYHLLGSKDITVTHNNDGSFPTTNASIYANSYHMSGSASGRVYANKIDRLATVTSGVDFNDETQPTITFNNPANFQLAPYLSFWSNNVLLHQLTRAKGTYSSPYTWEITETERQAVRQALSNINSCIVSEGLDTYNGNTKLGSHSTGKNFTIINANPTFNSFEFEDTNTTTVALTGDNQKIIQGYSNVKVTIPTSYIATANKEATMTKYSFVCSDVQTDITYSSSESTNATINNVKSGVFNVYAIDSRNNSTLVTKNATQTIAYNSLVKGEISVTRQNGVSEETNLSLNGKVDLVNFGSVTNSIQEAKYRYKVTDSSTWSNYKNITVTTDSNGNFSFNGLIQGDTNTGFDEANAYNIEVVVSDRLSTITYTANIGSGIPNIALHKDGVGIMGKYDTNEGGELQVKGKNIFTNITTGSSVRANYKSDGNDVYVLRVAFSSGPGANATVNVDTGLTNKTIDKIEGVVGASSAIPIIVPDAYTRLRYRKDNGRIYFDNKGNESYAVPGYLDVYYH